MIIPNKKDIVVEFIEKCDKAMTEKDDDCMSRLVKEIVSVYKSHISGIKDDLNSFSLAASLEGWPIDYFGDLRTLRAKLRIHLAELSESPSQQAPLISVVNQSNSISTAQNNISILMQFDETRKKLTEMESLADEDTKIALEKLDELLSIVKSKESRKGKWSKISNILRWLAGKGVELAITLAPVLLQSINGLIS